MKNKKSKIDSDERYRAIYESSHDAIMTLEPPDWKFTSGNPATVAMFGAEDEEDFISRAPWNYSPEFQPDGESSSDAAARQIGKAMSEGSAFFEWTHTRLSGEEFPATVLLTKTTVAGIDFLQATVRDITERKKIEDELESKLKELERFNKAMVGREMKMKALKEKIVKMEELVSEKEHGSRNKN